MTRVEAATWKYTKAGERSLDSAAVMRCAERGGGCTLLPYGSGTESPHAVEIHDFASRVVPCARHQPSKRFAWLHDVSVDDVLAHANAADGAFAVDELRRYLPRKHLDWRAGR